MADRSVLVRIRGDASDLVRAAATARTAMGGLRKEIDTTNDRTAWLAQSILALGPAVAPLGAAAIPALSGIATQMTVAGVAAVSTALAFNGVIDATKSLNDYQLEPTAENFQKLQIAMEKIGPAGEDFVRFIDSIGPQFTELQMAAREGMFPGMEEGLTHLLDLLPQVERIIGNVSEGMGELSADAGKGLSGKGFSDFFNYLETDAKPILIDMGQTVGNFAEGLAQMLVEFAPLSEDFTTGLLNMSEGFVEWSHGLDSNKTFQDFVAYVQESGPKALDLLGSMIDAFVQILEAAAPVGDVMVPALSALFDVIGAIANTPLGPIFLGAAAAMSAYGRAAALASITTGGLGKALIGLGPNVGAALKGSQGAIAQMGAIRSVAPRAAAGVGLLALSMTDLDNKMGVSQTAMGAMAGMMIGGPWGAAIGAGIGGVMDLAAANDKLVDAIERADHALDTGLRSSLRESRDELRSMLAETERGFTAGAFFEDLTHIGDDADFGTAAMNELTGAADDARGKLSDVERALRGNRDFAGLLAAPLGETADAFHDAAMSAEEFSESVGRAFALLDKRAALREARAAIRDFNKTLREAPNNLREGSAAYDEVEDALDKIARSSLEAAEQMKGMSRVRFLDRQRNAFIHAATDMGLTAKAARELADDFGLLNRTKVNPKLDADNRPAKGKIDEANKWLDFYGAKRPKSRLDADNTQARGKVDEANKWLSVFGTRKEVAQIQVESNAASTAAEVNSILDRIPDEIVQIHAVRSGAGGQRGGYGSGGFADGGYTGAIAPDAIAGVVHGREYVFSASATKGNEAFLDALHRDLRGYKDGGYVIPAGMAAMSQPQVSVSSALSLAGARFVLDVPGMGQLMTRVVDARIESNDKWKAGLDDRD